MKDSPIRHPSAFTPVAMSLAALALLLAHVARFGVTHETDEGTSAHLFQLLMGGQVPIIAYFAITWLPRNAGPALRVLALQAFAALAALGTLYWFEHLA